MDETKNKFIKLALVCLLCTPSWTNASRGEQSA